MAGPEPLRYLSAADLERALPVADAIDALEAVFRDAGAGKAQAAARTVMEQPLGGGRRSLLLAMPASWSGHGFAAKVSSFIADNPSHGRPAVQGLAALLDPATGDPLLVVDAGALTVRRTAAMVGLATRYLARADARVVGLIGTGALARDMVHAVAAVRVIQEVRAFNRTAARAHEVAAQLPWPTRVESSPEAVAAAADVLVVATSSTEPVVDGSVIRPGTHINAVGNFSPQGREIDGPTVARASPWVDSWEGALAEAGDLLLAASEGLIPAGRDGIRGDLAALVTAAPGGRRSREEITLFKSVGTALADIGALWAAQRTASAYGMGTVLC